MRFRHKKTYLGLVLLLVLVLAGLKLKASFNGPAEGVINQPSSSNSQSQSGKQLIKYSGQYLNFSYPKRYRLLNQPLSGRYLEVASLYSSDNSQVSVTIGVLPESLSDDSGINFRLNNPKLYKEVSVSGGYEFIDRTNGYEINRFVAHANLVASLVVSAPSEGAIGGDFSTISNSFSWH